MAKTRKDRPALNGMQILDLIQRGKLKVSYLDQQSPVMIVMKGTHVWQRWIEKDKEGIVHTKSGSTYLGTGIFLCPIWQTVPVWKVDYYDPRVPGLSKLGIFPFGNKYSQLTYNQVDGLDKAYRQPLHVLDTYLEKLTDFPTTMSTAYGDLMKIGRITMITKRRYERIRYFAKIFMNKLLGNRKLMEIIAKRMANNLPYSRKYVPKIAEVIEYCEIIKSRPMNLKLNYAKRSLVATIKYIELEDFEKAESHLRTAIKNMTYPEPTTK